MNPYQLRKNEHMLGNRYNYESFVILTTPFDQLNAASHQIFLDEWIRMLNYDLLPEDEICRLFNYLDCVNRYEDMTDMICLHPKILSVFFEDTQGLFEYNLEHKWNKSLDDFTHLMVAQYLNDLKDISEELPSDNKLKVCVIDKILEKYGVLDCVNRYGITK